MIKHAQLDFGQVNATGLKDLVSAINSGGANVVEVEGNNRATRKDGVNVKTAKIILEDGQNLSLQVNDTGDVSAVKLNGKAIPNGQSPDIKTLGATMAKAASVNSAKFQASLIAKAKRVANPVDKKTAVKSNFQRLKEAKERNQAVTKNLSFIEQSSGENQKAISDLTQQQEAVQARLTLLKADNQRLTIAIQQLQAGS